MICNFPTAKHYQDQNQRVYLAATEWATGGDHVRLNSHHSLLGNFKSILIRATIPGHNLFAVNFGGGLGYSSFVRGQMDG